MWEEGEAVKLIEVSGSIQKRESVLNKLQPGDPIYLKGHLETFTTAQKFL